MLRFSNAYPKVLSSKLQSVLLKTKFKPQFRLYSDIQTQFQTTGEKVLFDKLLVELNPSMLKVTDTSSGCGAMYMIEIVSDKFINKRVLQQHRMVNEILREEIGHMHGLRIISSSPK